MSLEKPKYEDPYKLLFQFTDYHEPLNRWPFVSSGSKGQITSHGGFPLLIHNKSRTKGVTHTQRTKESPSDRIAANYSPQVKNIKISNLRKWRRRQPHSHISIIQQPPSRKDHPHRPPLTRQYSSKDDSVWSSMFKKRQHFLPSVKSLDGVEKLSSFRSKRRNTTQLFPYKSCQRLKARNPYFESKSIHRVSGYTTPIIYIEASLPNSPTRQIEMLRQSSELSSYDLEEDFEQTQLYFNYVNKGDIQIQEPRTPKNQKQNIRGKLKESWLSDLMMKKHVALLFREVDLDYGFAERVSIVNYILLDPKERKRLKISMAPPSGVLSSSCKFIIRAPVPWHQSYIISKQYCRHNLFITNPIMQRIKVIWDLRYASLRFVQVHQLRNLKTMEPLSPKDMEEKILNQCDSARNTLMKRWLPEIGMVFVTMRKEWRTLVPSKNNESLRQVQKFFNCVAALMSQQLRSMAIQSLMDFAQLMKKYTLPRHVIQSNILKECFHINPALKIELTTSKEAECASFHPPLLEARDILIDCMKEIVLSTAEFPRIEVEIFPDLKNKPFYLFAVDWKEDFIQNLVSEVMDIFDSNIIGPKEYIRSYEAYKDLLDGSVFEQNAVFLKREPSLTEFGDTLLEYSNLNNRIQKIPISINLCFFSLDCHSINAQMLKKSEEIRSTLIQYLVELNKTWNRSICDKFDQMATKLGEIPEETSVLVQLQRYLKISITETTPELMKRIKMASQRVLFLLDYTIFPTEDIQLNTRVFQWPQDMAAVFELAKKRTGHKRDQIEEILRDEIDRFEDNLKQTKKELDVFIKKDPPVLTMEEMKTSVGVVERLEKQSAEARVKLEAINKEEIYLDWDPSEYSLLLEMSQTIELFSTLWHMALDFHEKYERWYNGPLKGLDPNEIQKMVEEMLENATKLAKVFSDTPSARRIAETMRSKIEKFRAYLPVLHTLCNSGMRDRHWDQISAANGSPIFRKEDTSLGDMIEAGLHKIIPQLEEIGSSASKEFALELAMGKMKEEWQSVQFDCIPYRESGVSILSGVEEIQQMLDDHILKAQTMHSSAYIKPFEAEMTSWEDKLISMQDILDAWLRCQESWLYLEPIFNSEDIMKQMPNEGRKFNKVDRIWRNIMAKTVADPQVLQATSQSNMLVNLQEANDLLDEIMKGLNDYLEKKRLYFPRFFFLSNDELLEILSETKDPLRVQPHIKKCFEGIESLIFQTDKFGNQDIIGMKSLAEEEVSFTNTIFTADAKGMVEKWLLQLEKQMIMSLKDIINKSISDFYQTPLLKWCLYWPGQVVSVSSMLNWTSDASEAIEKSSLKSFLDKFNNQLSEIVSLIQNGLSSRAELNCRNLVILNVHARNVIERIYEQNVLSIQDFNWKSQLRYYQGNDSGEVFVEMVTTRIQYGYEYIGNSPRLVMTPLTERCYRTLMGALKMHLGGAPEGPAGSGKTETCKDLAKAVAKQCVIFNCSDGIDYHGMGKFLKGLAQSGAWACFDEFNRIDLDVLSVVAQQIQTIQNAIASNLTTFNFEGAELTLNKSCSIFITMNPSYGTRKAIPDNLKLLFRPVAMMLPDISMIAQVTLYAMGFQNARSLAKKIIDAYKLCSEQLSYQAHYDFGMRAVKSTLTATGKLRLKTPELTDENKLILIGLLEVNMPKFIQDDIFLFKGILKDLFPDELSDDLFNKLIHKGQLIECIKKACLSSRLQPTPEFVDKTFQIYSSMQINHGIMIIGETMSCKTTSYQTLAKALSLLADEFKSEKGALFKIINPKSITMNQLYGLFDPVSREWSDGVLGKTFREMAVSNVPERKWIIFDGPVDSIWIENLNTVLDDSKKLCLMNGEIIHMTPSMNLIFEVGCLQNASPATVGRCGMIYMESRILGWRPIKKSFLESLPQNFTKELLQALEDLFEWLIAPCLKQIAKYKLFISYSELHLFHSFLRFLRAVLKVSESDLGKDGSKTSNDNSIDIIDIQTNFLFAILWGLCSTITKVDRGKFDTFFRNLVDGLIKGHSKPPSFKLARANLIPEQGSIFDYTLDPNKIGSWLKWSTFVDNNGVIRNDSENLIVSTTETVKQSYFLDLAITYEYPLGIIGPSGTGKSFITNSLVQRLSSEKFITNVINFSAQTTVNYTQEVVMSKLDRRRKGVFGPAMGKKCVVFIDDLNLPQADEYGSVPPLELLRQWIDHGYWYEKKDSSKLELLDVLLFAALTPSTGNDLSSRFMRHLNILGIDDFEDETLRRIFSTNISFHFQKKNYELAVANLALPLIEASLSVYKEVLKDFLPTPTKCHYVYNLRDFARVIQGIKMVPNTHLKDPNKLIRLWCHETYRVFYDRLVNDDDRNMFFKIIKHHVQVEFKVDLSKILFPHTLSGASIVADEHLRSLCFGDYMHPEVENKIYDEVPDVSLLTKAMEHYLQEYNASGSRAPMSLVMFRFAVEHISRINRIIKTGHAMLVGIGGTGRQSLAKLATFIARYELFQIEINRTYGLVAWRNDLRKVLKKAGAEGKKVVFLFTDQQIQEESFLEDISMILNTGEVPNLFNSEEKAEILDRVQMNSKSYRSGQDMGGASDASFANLYNLFLQNIKNNLHIVICMSPIGTAFRRRLRMFPSLLNCCTLNWFSEWPQDALVRVATKFLEDMNMEDENVRHSCVVMCGHFHETVRNTSIKFYEEFQRNNYVTPTSYLSLILTFKSLLKGKRDEILNTKTRYEMGLGKLEYASSQVAAMQKELTALRPQLLDTSDDTEKLMIKIEQDTIQVEAKKEIVACDEALANEAAAAAQAIRDDCENDLAEAIPALQSAVNSLDTLNPNDITVVKTMKNPAPIVKFVVEAVCVMKGVLPDRRPDLENKGRLIDDYWSPGQKMMGDIKFLDTLRAYDKDNISPSIMKKIREKYVTNPYFDPNLVKKVSTACEGLCKWVRAIEVYDRVIKIVSPKKAKLAEAETELARQMDKLNDKRAQLQAVTDKLQALNDEFAAMTKKKKDLEDNIRLCSEKLDRAEKLIKGLGGERDRWSSMADSLGFKLKNITGDVLLASGAVAYLGAFNVSFRKSIILDWQNECAAQKIPCSDNFSLINILGEPVQIRQWQIAGLPKDLFSVENGLIVKNSNRWPLMIDPQGQASKWIKNMEKENLCIIKYSDPEYLLSLANAIQSGAPVLLEGVGDNLDPGLESVLMKRTFKNKGSECINVGSQVIEYDPNFHLYIVTSLRNPHFPPEVAIKVTLLNFMITPEGLQDQLLGILAAAEKPELEEMKNKLIVDGAKNKKQLKDIEDKILKVLSTSQGNILEDETAIRILSSSKVLSEEIEAKQEVASKTEKEIDRTRDGYNPVATHASVLFFCVSELSQIDPMYQFSLPWFIQIYVQSINDTPSSKSKSKEKGDTDRRISNLNTNFTEIIYRKISRSLLREHVLVFSFILSLRLSGEDNWQYILKEVRPIQHNQPIPPGNWISEKMWNAIVSINKMESFQGLMASLRDDFEAWKEFYYSASPSRDILPNGWRQIRDLDYIFLLKILRPDRVIFAIRDFVSEKLGRDYVYPQILDLKNCYEDSDSSTPIILILSPGADPLASINSIQVGSDKAPVFVRSLSLGQGQGPKAESLLISASREGGWIILQNCHLSPHWMNDRLEAIWEDEVNIDPDPRFRLWLTSYPTEDFPPQILQLSIKVSLQSPNGLKANLSVAFSSPPISTSDFYDVNECPLLRTVFRRLVYGLSFFHGITLERLNYEGLGWNDVTYEFTWSDLNISLHQLKDMLLSENNCTIVEEDKINFAIEKCIPALQYLIGECNYGGRVREAFDRRLLSSLLKTCFNISLASTHRANISGNYFIPGELQRANILEIIARFSDISDPDAVGLHENAALIRNESDGRKIINWTHLATRYGEFTDMMTWNLSEMDKKIARFMESLPLIFDLSYVYNNFPVQYEDSINTTLRLEITRYNALLILIKDNFERLSLAIKGKIALIPEIEIAYREVNSNNVLSSWRANSYDSLRSLDDYLNNLKKRIEFFIVWIESNNRPDIYWISAFFFPQSLLTSVLQNFARKRSLALNQVEFEYIVLRNPYQSPSEEVEGIIIDGIYLEGASWDDANGVLTECLPKIHHSKLPPMLLRPRQVYNEMNKSNLYKCPVYRNEARKGNILATGHSTNYVFDIKLPSNVNNEHWILRGVAGILELRD